MMSDTMLTAELSCFSCRLYATCDNPAGQTAVLSHDEIVSCLKYALLCRYGIRFLNRVVTCGKQACSGCAQLQAVVVIT